MDLRKPTVLLADSQLLFCADQTGARFLERMRAVVSVDEPRAAYLGAANGDQPEFYELFASAMAGVGITRCRHVPAEPTTADRVFLEEADVVLLAGGDVGRGFDAFTRADLAQVLVRLAYGGTLMVGISAGAVHLGLSGYAGEQAAGEPLDLLRVVPFAVDAHDEPDWARLRRVVHVGGAYVRGLGMPRGGGALVHPDGTVEAVRREVVLFVAKDDGLEQVLAVPPPSLDIADVVPTDVAPA